jgi:aquaporin Z
MTKITLGKKVAVEALGTFFFVVLGAGAVVAASFAGLGSSSLLVIALANGLGLALAISFAMGISGGHINPAVTIAMLVNKKINVKDAVAYIVAQLFGAILAGFILLFIYPRTVGIPVHYGAPALSSSTGIIAGIGIEALMTFFLVMAVFLTAVDKRAPKIAGFGVGLTVFLDVLVAGPLTGAAMNPARAIGPALASGYFSNWYVWLIGPIIGAVIAALLYKYLEK